MVAPHSDHINHSTGFFGSNYGHQIPLSLSHSPVADDFSSKLFRGPSSPTNDHSTRCIKGPSSRRRQPHSNPTRNTPPRANLLLNVESHTWVRGALFHHAPPHVDESPWTLVEPHHRRKITILPIFFVQLHIPLGFSTFLTTFSSPRHLHVSWECFHLHFDTSYPCLNHNR